MRAADYVGAIEPLPKLTSDDAAERFVAQADLTPFDLSAFKPHSFEFALTAMIDPGFPALGIEEEALETVLATLIEYARQSGASALAITSAHRGQFASLALTDNGPGVPEADRVRVFDPFFTSKREAGGTGLGLPIARALAESRGGSLELGETGNGACFVLTLRGGGVI